MKSKPISGKQKSKQVKGQKKDQNQKHTQITGQTVETIETESQSVMVQNSSQGVLANVLNSYIHFSPVANFNLLKSCDGIVYYFGADEQKKKKQNLEAIIESHALEFQKQDLLNSDKKVIHFMGQTGPVWIIFEQTATAAHHSEALNESAYAFARETMGSLVSSFQHLKLKNISIYFQKANALAQQGAVVGLELASYQFLKLVKNEDIYQLNIQTNIKQELLIQACQIASSVQLARHMVNLPPNKMNPETVQLLAESLEFSSSMSVEVWDERKCEEERMNLLLAVGAGAAISPRLVKLSYRPKNSKKAKKPVAFVGKGITFDTGGLDIKPSSAMRLMKKDMGGAAAVMALAYWVDHSKYERPCDFYLALAENSVDGFSMRPSDVYESRAGYFVEIDNTDAEGRLVLADAMDVAVKQTGLDDPEYVIDLATLTGAIKVALGADVAGLFSNDDKLSEKILVAGQKSGELSWRMPLIQKYFAGMSSQFADFKNSADGFGGAITAALFLQKFAGDKKWAHLDIYAWNDKPTGCLTAGSASGQPVQSMIEFLKSVE